MKQEDHFNIKLNEVSLFKQNNNNNLPTHSATNETEIKLARWVNIYKEKFKKNILEADKILKFNTVDPNILQYKNDVLFNTKYIKLDKFIDTNRKYPSFSVEVDLEETELAGWRYIQDKKYIRNEMSEYQHNKWSTFKIKHKNICESNAVVLCTDDKCIVCFPRSFASSDKVHLWSNKNVDENGVFINPRFIFKLSYDIFWFNCDYHEFQNSPNNITYSQGEGCLFPCCSNGPKKICDLDECVICTDTSFASSIYAQYWLNEKNIDENGKLIRPRDVFKSTNLKFWFQCKNNHPPFKKSLNDISSKGSFCFKCSSNGFSQIAICWLEQLMSLNTNLHIQHALNEGEFFIKELNTCVDGYCKETNTVYEFHGDYWHGNPRNCKREDINLLTKKTFGELYDKTIIREQNIRDLGYNLIIMWELDCVIDESNESVKTVLKKMLCSKKVSVEKITIEQLTLWNNYYKELTEYFDKYNNIPSKTNFIGRWFKDQKSEYKSGRMNKQRSVKWKELNNNYPELTSMKCTFSETYDQLSLFFQQNSDRLPLHDHPIEGRLNGFISLQKRKFSENTMKVKNREKWIILRNLYPNLLKSNDEVWDEFYMKLLNYIREFNKLPYYTSEMADIKSLGYWKDDNKFFYLSGEMKKYSEDRYNKWTFLFITYPLLFSRDKVWNTNSDNLRKFCNTNKNKLPELKNNKNLRNWVNDQRYDYCHNLMTPERKIIWAQLVKDFPILYVDTRENIWLIKYKNLKTFIDRKQIPTLSGDKFERTCATWYYNQLRKYNENKLLENQKVLWKELMKLKS